MRFSAIHIDGFGIFHEASLDGLPGGLVIIQGNNETGKSTLLEYIRTVLFGFPARSPEQHYPPVGGGAHGGRLGLVMSSDKQLVVQRRVGGRGGDLLITTGESEVLPPERLGELLGGATSELYRNIYAFGLGELQELESLEKEGVRRAIYGASMGTAMDRLPKAQSYLDATLAKRFTSRGRTGPIINAKLGELKEVGAKLERARRGITDYEEACDRLARTEEEIAALNAELQRIRVEASVTQAYFKAWGDWVELRDLEERRPGPDEVVESFPADGVEQLAGFRSTLAEKQSQLTDAETQQKELQREADDLEIDENLLAQADAITRLAEERVTFIKGGQELPVLVADRDHLDEAIKRLLAQLGPAWTEERALSIDLSLFTDEAIEAHEAKIDQAQQEYDRRSTTLRARQEDLDRAQRAASDARQALDELRDSELDVDEAVLQALEAGRQRFADLIRDLDHARDELERRQEDCRQAAKEISEGWTVEDVKRFETTGPAQHAMESLLDRFGEINKEIATAESDQHAAERSLNDRQEALATAQKALEDAPKPSMASRAALQERGETLRVVRSKLRARRDLEKDEAHCRQRLEDRRREQQRTGAGPAPAVAAIPKWLWGVGVVVIAAAPAILVWLGKTDAALGLGVGLLLVGVYAGARRMGRRATGGGIAPDVLRREIDELETQHKQYCTDLETCRREIAEQLERVELSATSSPGELERWEQDVRRDEARFDELERLERAERDADGAVGAARQGLADAEQALAKLKEARAALRGEWDAYLKTVGLSGTEPSERAMAIFQKVDGVKQRIRSAEELAKQADAMSSALADYRGLAHRIPALRRASEDPDDGALGSAVDGFLARFKANQAKRLRAEQTSTDAETRAEQTERERDRAQAERDRAADEKDAIVGTWQRWLADFDRGFPASLSPTLALRALGELRTCNDQIASRDRMTEDIRTAQEQLAAYEGLAEKTFAALGRPIPEADALSSAVAGLAGDLGTHRSREAQRQEKLASVSARQREAERLRAEIRALEAQRAELLNAAGAVDEEDFFERAQRHKDQQELSRNIAEKERILRVGAGQSDLAAIRERLGATSREELEATAEGLEHDAEEAERRIQSLQKDVVQIESEQKQMSNADDVAQLRSEQEVLLAEIRQAAAEWRRYATARFLLDKAREKFEREQQPGVIRDASAFLEKFTCGRYAQVFKPLDSNQSPHVVTPDEQRKEARYLSRGTAEQLYLALRFGYIRHRSRDAEPLPVVMDDIMVNFDAERRQCAAKAILELAREHQILFFTCHPPHVDTFKQVRSPVAPVTVFRLEEGVFVRS